MNSQPLVIGEDEYNNRAVAAAIATFIHTASRPVVEVMEWPNVNQRSDHPRCPRPPYRIDAYKTALTGKRGVTRLTASLSNASFSFTTQYGQPVTALEAGSYTLNVRDHSKLRGFAFAGKSTTRPFRGLKTWTLTLRPGFYRDRVLGETATERLGHRPRKRLAFEPPLSEYSPRVTVKYRVTERTAPRTGKRAHICSTSLTPFMTWVATPTGILECSTWRDVATWKAPC